MDRAGCLGHGLKTTPHPSLFLRKGRGERQRTSFIALKIADVTIGSMVAESSASTLQICPACGASFDTSDAEPLARVECPNCGEKVRAERMFDNFLIIETVGMGGMGTVYKARFLLQLRGLIESAFEVF